MDAGWKRPRDAWGVYLWWPDVGNGIIAPLQARIERCDAAMAGAESDPRDVAAIMMW